MPTPPRRESSRGRSDRTEGDRRLSRPIPSRPDREPRRNTLENSLLGAIGDEPAGYSTAALCKALKVTAQVLGDPFQNLLDQRKVFGFAGLWFSPKGFFAGANKFLDTMEFLHKKHPSSSNLEASDVAKKAALPWSGKSLDRIMERLSQDRKIVLSDAGIRLPEFEVKPSARQKRFLDSVIAALETQPLNTPNAHQISLLVNAPIAAVVEALKLGMQMQRVLEIAEDVYYTPAQIEALMVRTEMLMKARAFTPPELRDALGTSRKYVVPILEHFDRVGFTRKRGDERKVNR